HPRALLSFPTRRSSDLRVTSVSGSWTQPSATCDGKHVTAFGVWVGIDDDSTNPETGNLEQLGTAINCVVGSTRPQYYVWFEMFPDRKSTRLNSSHLGIS